MKERIISKSFAVAVIILFVGLAIQPSIAVQPETEIDVEPKNYLFQTIIDIANNPEVKNLLEQYDNDLYKVDIDRSIYRKIFFRNSRLFNSLIFTKPSLTYEFLDKTYNNGIEITNIIGEDKALELIESIEVSDTEVFNEFNNIISKDEELSVRITTLEEMNKESNSYSPFWDNYPIICSIMFLIVLFDSIIILGLFNFILSIAYLFFSLFKIQIITDIIFKLANIRFNAHFTFIVICLHLMVDELECLEIFPD